LLALQQTSQQQLLFSRPEGAKLQPGGRRTNGTAQPYPLPVI